MNPFHRKKAVLFCLTALLCALALHWLISLATTLPAMPATPTLTSGILPWFHQHLLALSWAQTLAIGVCALSFLAWLTTPRQVVVRVTFCKAGVQSAEVKGPEFFTKNYTKASVLSSFFIGSDKTKFPALHDKIIKVDTNNILFSACGTENKRCFIVFCAAIATNALPQVVENSHENMAIGTLKEEGIAYSVTCTSNKETTIEVALPVKNALPYQI
jgi:hypothetical protein